MILLLFSAVPSDCLSAQLSWVELVVFEFYEVILTELLAITPVAIELNIKLDDVMETLRFNDVP